MRTRTSRRSCSVITSSARARARRCSADPRQEGLSYGVGSQFNAPVKSNGARFAVQAISAAEREQVEVVPRRGRDRAA
jgi:hypothetical protein